MPRLRIFRWRPWGRHRPVVVYEDDLDRERRLTYKHIDRGPFDWLTVFVAGAGFLTDIYNIVAGKISLSMLEIVYWNGSIPPSRKNAINQAMLVGMLIGQVTFGVLGDRYGRKGTYGIVLIIIMGATIGLSLSSRGIDGSVNILPWLIVWRLIMGFGMGGGFPLSAAITAEFAPRRHRGKMLAAVFFMKPVGEILANVVAIVAIVKSHRHIPDDADQGKCDDECLRAVDSIWRWIVGLGAILPVGALILRLLIPESLRYTLEVEKDVSTVRHYREENFSQYLEDEETQPAEQITDDRITGSQPSGPSTQAASVWINHAQGHEEQSQNWSADNMANHFEQNGHNTRREVRKDTWAQFWKGFREFLFTDREWRERRWIEGSWTNLAGTSLTWLLLDMSFYLLGLYDPGMIKALWKSPKPSATIYPKIKETAWRALISNSIGAFIGGAIFIAMARYRYNLQFYGFLILAALFVAVGVAFLKLAESSFFAVTIIFYAGCRLFFNLGPNPSVFIIPAEVFPTRFRCTCYGISAAAGKLGSILAQSIIQGGDLKAPRLGKLILMSVERPDGFYKLTWLMSCSSFTTCNILGAFFTKLWVPNPCDANGESRELDDPSYERNAR